MIVRAIILAGWLLFPLTVSAVTCEDLENYAFAYWLITENANEDETSIVVRGSGYYQGYIAGWVNTNLDPSIFNLPDQVSYSEIEGVVLDFLRQADGIYETSKLKGEKWGAPRCVYEAIKGHYGLRN